MGTFEQMIFAGRAGVYSVRQLWLLFSVARELTAKWNVFFQTLNHWQQGVYDYVAVLCIDAEKLKRS